ncbi:MAG TPA: polysaccharide pyruvyl transferase family protein, partial [Bacilli bacterium]|nr:polysaccharide pyruvyl transferase family protein [Bacilli bacterium]
TFNFLKAKLKIDIKNRMINKCIKNSDYYIKVGGSIFIENNPNYKEYDREYKTNKNTYILGSNFGPYESNEYYDYFNNLYNNIKDMCFRDKYSHDLFSSSRYASDIVFNLDASKYNKNKKNRIVISMIDLNNYKNLKKYVNEYDNLLINIIKKYQKDYEIYLMGFCKNEGDLNVINRIYNRLEDNTNIKCYLYDGNLNEALNIISESKIVFATRFHANILGLLFNLTIIPIIYSNKTKELLKDIGFNKNIIDIKNIQDNYEFDLNYKKNIDEMIKIANVQFEKLDKEL